MLAAGQNGEVEKMVYNQKRRPQTIIGPTGQLLTLDNLPPPDTTRWVIRRKAEVVAAVKGGLLSVDEACQRYRLSVEEYLSWQQLVERNGLPGLRSTRTQQYRPARAREMNP